MPYVANEILSRAPILLQLSETFQEFSILMTFLLFKIEEWECTCNDFPYQKIIILPCQQSNI